MESGILGKKSAETILSDKDYNKAMRTHKLTFQVHWRMLLPDFITHLSENYDSLRKEIEKTSCSSELIALLEEANIQIHVRQFAEGKYKENPNSQYIWQYLEMVILLLMLTRSYRDGDWKLHLEAFKQMVPYFMKYDHTHFSKCGPLHCRNEQLTRTSFK